MRSVIITTIALAAAVAQAGVIGLLSNRAVSPDNSCGGANGYSCPASLPCCSQHGWCGTTTDYCGTGCQAGFGTCGTTGGGTTGGGGGTGGVSPDFTCGGANGYTCPGASPCCSVNGWCGSTADYCGTGCQAGFGTCTGGGGTTGGGTTGGGQGNGDTCGAGVGSCGAGLCCSLAGYCGTGSDFCQAPICQTAYGPACDANQTPAGASTAGAARPKNGGVLYGAQGIYDCVNPGEIAITYDDGPYLYTQHVLDTFAAYGAKATFFITGNNNGKGAIDTTPAWTAAIQRMAADGHQIASHTWSHADLSTLTSDGRRSEMIKNEMAIRNIVGYFPTYMRPPYSSCNDACQADMADLGYHISYFDLDTDDYNNATPALIGNAINNFNNALTGRDPAVDNFLAIAHDIHQTTAYDLTDYMLQRLTNAGYRAVTMGQCLGDPQANWYRT